jgi:hypothetical protein
MEMTKYRTSTGQQAERLFQALKKLGPGWHSRAEIAARIGKPRITGLDASALDLLVETGQVEAERHEINAPIQQRWEYRVKEGK